MTSPLISITMPVYNVAAFLPECIDSILAQTLQEWELVAVNDGSTDDSLSILESYAARDARVRVISQANGGYGKAMNTGMKAARGEYLAIVESDDVIAPEMYKSLYDLAKKHDADVAKGGYKCFWDIDHEPRRYELGGLCPASLVGLVHTPAIKHECYQIPLYNVAGIYRRSWVEQWGIEHHETPGASYQDNGFWFQVLSFAESAVWINEPFYHYRQTNINSSIHKKGDYDVALREFDFIESTMREKSPERWEMVKPAFATSWWAAMYYTYKRIDPKFHAAFLSELDSRMKIWLKQGLLSAQKSLSYREAEFLLSMQKAQTSSTAARVSRVACREWLLDKKQKLKKIIGR